MEFFLRKFDLFSQTPSLKINGKKMPSTLFGSCIGLISISFLLSTIIYVIYSYLKRLSLTIDSFIEVDYHEEINLKEMNIGFLITDFLGREFPDQDRMFTIQAKFWEIYVPPELNNITKSADVKIENIDIIKCTQLKQHQYERNFKTYSQNYKNIVCLDLANLNRTISGIFGNYG
jgi:hypothetical protein